MEIREISEKNRDNLDASTDYNNNDEPKIDDIKANYKKKR